MDAVRPAAVAGLFYPDDPLALRDEVQRHLRDARPSKGPPPKAIIAPHAGYAYSGPVAGSAYARLAPLAGVVRRVVLLGPCHRVAVRGLALPSVTAFETPLGRVPVDVAAARRARELPQVSVSDATHRDEHSLEVHLPFLQIALDDFSVVPFVVGSASAAEVAQVLDLLWGGPETLIVVSSDLSHYLDYGSAKMVDAETCTAIEGLAPERLDPEGACGRVPVGGLLVAAMRHGLDVTTVDLRSSGDTAGDRRRVVGYGAWVFTEGGAA